METPQTELVPPAPPLVPVPADGREYLTVEEIAAAYETTKSTVNRWLTIGVTVWDGQGNKRRLILKGRKIGARWKVPPAALAEFLKDIGGAPESPPPAESETEKRRRVSACLDKLAASGLL